MSFDTPENTAKADCIGMIRIHEAVRLLGLTKKPNLLDFNVRIIWFGLGFFKNKQHLYLSYLQLYQRNLRQLRPVVYLILFKQIAGKLYHYFVVRTNKNTCFLMPTV